MPIRTLVRFAVVLGTTAFFAFLPSAATADSGSWACTASALRFTQPNSKPAEPVIANPTVSPCLPDAAGGSGVESSSGPGAHADGAHAETVIAALLAPAEQRPTADASTQNAKTSNSSAPTVEFPGTVSSKVQATCVAGQPQLTATSSTAPVIIGGQTIPTDQPATDTLTSAGNLAGAVLTIKPAEDIRTGSSLTRRALHLTLHLSSGQTYDYVVAESTVSYAGNPCANEVAPVGSVPGGTSTGGNGNGSGAGNSGGSSNGGGSGNGSGANGTSNGQGRGSAASSYGVGFDAHGLRIDATRTVLGGKWTRVRVECSRKAKAATCREKLVVFRIFRYTHAVLIGRRTVGLRPGRWAIFSVRTRPYPRYPVYAQLQ